MSDQTPDPADVIAGWLWRGDMDGLLGESARSASGELLDALTAAGLQIVPAPKHVAGVSAHQWTDEYKPTAPASMSPRQAALEILAELDWSVVIEGLSMHEDMDPLAYYGLRAELSDVQWLDSRWFMGAKFRSHLTAWVTSRMTLKSWCLNEDHHDGDMIWFNDCQYGDEEHSPCEWGYCWALDGDPEGFLTLAMDLLREGWGPEEVVPVVDDATRQEVEARMDWLNRASKAIYLEVPAAVGDDVSAGMLDARRLLAAAYLPPPRLTDASYSGRTDK